VLNAAADLKRPLSVPSGKHLVRSLNAGESVVVKDNRNPSFPELLQTTPLQIPVSIEEVDGLTPGTYQLQQAAFGVVLSLAVHQRLHNPVAQLRLSKRFSWSGVVYV
jgi:hypothetical protein